MLTLNSHKKIIIWVAVITIIILSLILPINIKYNIYVKGKLLPNKEWIIYKGTDGRLTSLITNYRTGMNQSYDVTLFDRGDAMRFSFNQKLHSGSRLFVNDTVAIVYSNEIERQIENLKGEIIAAKASLSLNLTGEKEAIIEQENKTLDYSIKQSEEQKKILDRVKTLYDKGLASLEEYEIAKGTYELNVINSSISKARLQSVQTGAKKEQVSLIRSQIISLENELAILQKRFKGFTVTSPIGGVLSRKTNSDTLMSLYDNSEFVLLCPVKVSDIEFISDTARVKIKLNDKTVYARIYEKTNAVKIVNGIQIVTISADVDKAVNDLTPYLMADCYVDAGELSPVEYLVRIWQRMVN
ncbi:MAG: hypothetical protein IPH97_06875 [Ignavibacteriales bacterium]|nr:hypothetical protein [Ignavibacteriales bacterium]